MNLSKECKKKLIGLLYPVIIDWADSYGHKRPPRSFLLNYDYDFIDVANYAAMYNGREILSVGTCYNDTKKIKVASARSKLSVMQTLVHELIHVVQSFNYGRLYGYAYSEESRKNSHETNKYECEARQAEELFLDEWRHNKQLWQALFFFEYEYAESCPSYRAFEYYTPEISYWNDPNIRVHYRSWWLRR